jgi:hypothetical protein
MTPRRPGGSREDSLQEPPPFQRTPIGCLGFIYDSQLAGILYTKMPPESDGCEKSPTATFKKKSLTRYNFNTFCEDYI